MFPQILVNLVNIFIKWYSIHWGFIVYINISVICLVNPEIFYDMNDYPLYTILKFYNFYTYNF